jgi:protein O-GlcNAc transferase
MEEKLRAALEFHRHGRLAEAQQLYEQILAADPGNFDALHLFGAIKAAQHRVEEAAGLMTAALQQRPDSIEVLYNLGMVLQEQKKWGDAEALYRKALSIKPDFAEAHNNLGNVLRETNRAGDAIRHYQNACASRPDYAEAHNNLGNVLREQNRPAAAIASYRRAIAVNPHYAEAMRNLGNILLEQKKLDDAIASFRKAITIDPRDAAVHNNLGIALSERKNFAEAILSFRRALDIDPTYTDAIYNLGNALLDAGQIDAALACYRAVLQLAPDHGHAYGALLRRAMGACNWAESTNLGAGLADRFARGGFFIDPFAMTGISDSPALQQQCAKNYLASVRPAQSAPLFRQSGHDRQKIRIAYLSADYHEHATAYLMAGLFEIHDREKFEIIGASFGPDDNSDMRKRLHGAFDKFIDVSARSDLDAAKALSELEIDIAVDLKGYTKNARPGILAHRPAPVQVNYLGYPGTMGAEFIDYILGDRYVTPLNHQPYFTEKIVQLPDSYQVNDNKRAIAADTPTRAACGLPESGFVFCCFNKSAKIAPAIFDIWTRLLKAVDKSVLWLLSDSEITMRNLRNEAGMRGVAPDRLIFAPRVALDRHLARHRMADLFLDTLPYNAHTTASDALWSGLPVLTCTGNAFAGRVATSLLHAAGAPELVTQSLDEYEALALELATNRHRLTDIRTKLENAIPTCPLFDTNRFCKHIEAAYVKMYETWRRGESPNSFAVTP